MRVAEVMERSGGVASAAQLRRAGVGRRRLRKAVAEGEVVRCARGRYAVAAVGEHRAAAHALTGVLSHLSAALHHGWKVKEVPEVAQVVVPRTRRLREGSGAGCRIRWRDLAAGEVEDGVTTPLRTVLDCARDLPFDEALAVADSGLRSDLVGPGELVRAAAGLNGPGARSARLVAEHASGLAANPFESVLRAMAIVEGLDVRPQVQIAETGFWGRVDLADTSRRLVLEAESFEHHGNRKGFRKDVRRYTHLVVFGWTVLRFTWEEVMLQPEVVRWALRSWLAARAGRAVAPPPRPLARLT